MAQTIAEIEDRSVISPMMQKYLETKEEYKDCILFYRLGDFYEMFFEDALIAARELEITLTGKDCGLPERAPMAGIPHHAAEVYAEKLIEKGVQISENNVKIEIKHQDCVSRGSLTVIEKTGKEGPTERKTQPKERTPEDG